MSIAVTGMPAIRTVAHQGEVVLRPIDRRGLYDPVARDQHHHGSSKPHLPCRFGRPHLRNGEVPRDRVGVVPRFHIDVLTVKRREHDEAGMLLRHPHRQKATREVGREFDHIRLRCCADPLVKNVRTGRGQRERGHDWNRTMPPDLLRRRRRSEPPVVALWDTCVRWTQNRRFRDHPRLPLAVIARGMYSASLASIAQKVRHVGGRCLGAALPRPTRRVGRPRRLRKRDGLMQYGWIAGNTTVRDALS